MDQPFMCRKLSLAIAPLFLALAFGVQPADAQTRPRVIHVFVALADNQSQGIVPVPARLGNGSDPAHNLYWGAAFGVKSYFKASREWHLLTCGGGARPFVLERCVFQHNNPDAILVADAYKGANMREAVSDFVSSSAGIRHESVTLATGQDRQSAEIASNADLLVYVGHDAFMDFQIPPVSALASSHKREFIILDCASKPYFGPYMRTTGAQPLLWTTGLMAPEAYTLEAAISGWIRGENAEEIHQGAAAAYNKYQKCGLRAAQRLFATGW